MFCAQTWKGVQKELVVGQMHAKRMEKESLPPRSYSLLKERKTSYQKIIYHSPFTLLDDEQVNRYTRLGRLKKLSTRGQDLFLEYRELVILFWENKRCLTLSVVPVTNFQFHLHFSPIFPYFKEGFSLHMFYSWSEAAESRFHLILGHHIEGVMHLWSNKLHIFENV